MGVSRDFMNHKYLFSRKEKLFEYVYVQHFSVTPFTKSGISSFKIIQEAAPTTPAEQGECEDPIRSSTNCTS